MGHEPAAEAHPGEPAAGHAGHPRRHGGHGHGGGHKGGHDAGGHGGHSCRWIVTYSDMITLLMACFIMIITFSSKEPEKYSKRRDSLAGGVGGSGSAGPEREALERDAVAWRIRPPKARLTDNGSEMPPLYSDPAEAVTAAEALHALESPAPGSLRNSYTLGMPIGLVFTPDGAVSPAGARLARALAHTVWPLPYDVHVRVDDRRDLPRAVRLVQYLVRQEGIFPGRLGAGVSEGGDRLGGWLRIDLVRQR